MPMNNSLNIGDRVGSLTILDKYRDRVDEQPVLFYSLKCDCGIKFDVESKRWSRLKRDCGCGKNEDNRKHTMYFNVGLVAEEKIRRVCKQDNLAITNIGGYIAE